MKYLDNLDHRYKHKIKEKKPFYLWIKYPSSNNINKDLIEEAIGHSQPTYSMNSVDKSYLCLEMADRKKRTHFVYRFIKIFLLKKGGHFLL